MTLQSDGRPGSPNSVWETSAPGVRPHVRETDGHVYLSTCDFCSFQDESVLLLLGSSKRREKGVDIYWGELWMVCPTLYKETVDTLFATTAAAEPAEGPVSESSSNTKEIPLDCWDKVRKEGEKGALPQRTPKRDAGTVTTARMSLRVSLPW